MSARNVFSHKHSLGSESCGISQAVIVQFHPFMNFDQKEKDFALAGLTQWLEHQTAN